MIYTEKEIAQLSEEELMDIISIILMNGQILYFDQVFSIDEESVILKNDERIYFSNDESKKSTIEKYKKYKMFTIIHDSRERVSTLKLAENHLEEMMNKKINKFDKMAQESTKLMTDTMIKSISNIKTFLIQEIDPSIKRLNNISIQLENELHSKLPEINRQISNIKTDELNIILDKLGNITKMLHEVVE